ncbi:MAG: HyaD/HybD family hydrogenase maturation endopeptidase [Desulfobulbaceae bacterium]|nr:HyaD/HybD family hydrogenase maturation endopeptidase [Desulfobulbaceae bacterium]
METLVLGIGNLLLGDEGVGCRCVEELERRYVLPPAVTCVDGGTAGFELLPLIEDAQTLIIIDALKDGRPPGTLVLVEDEAVPRLMLTRTSPHQIGICEVLATAQLTGKVPQRLLLFGIEPKSLEVTMGLSPEISQALEKTLDAVVAALSSMGHQIQLRQTP